MFRRGGGGGSIKTEREIALLSATSCMRGNENTGRKGREYGGRKKTSPGIHHLSPWNGKRIIRRHAAVVRAKVCVSEEGVATEGRGCRKHRFDLPGDQGRQDKTIGKGRAPQGRRHQKRKIRAFKERKIAWAGGGGFDCEKGKPGGLSHGPSRESHVSTGSRNY